MSQIIIRHLHKAEAGSIQSSARTRRLHSVLTKRIIPCLDVQNGRVVKNVRFFENHRDAGDPLVLAQA